MRTLLLILAIFLLFSGCIEEENVTQSNESQHQDSVNLTLENLSSESLSSDVKNIPEIEVRSFASICAYNNLEIIDKYIFSWENVPGNENQSLINYLKNELYMGWVDNASIVKTDNNKTIRVFTSKHSLELTLKNNDSELIGTIDSDPLYFLSQIKKENGRICVYRFREYRSVYNLTEEYYALYNLSITNNGSEEINFKLNELNVRDGNQIFNTTAAKPESQYSSMNEIISEFKKENKIGDITLLPGQTINGSVIFQVNSLYNESFILAYEGTPVTSASFEKGIKALRTAEMYNYSTVFLIPPYEFDDPETFKTFDSFEPNPDSYPAIWANWENRSVFEFLKKADFENMVNSSIQDIPPIDVVYALKVIPERNITMCHTIRSSSCPSNALCVDDTGEELINTSRIGSEVIILKHQTNFSNATVVKISYHNVYGWPLGSRLSFVDQDLILDDKMEIVAVRYYCGNFVS